MTTSALHDAALPATRHRWVALLAVSLGVSLIIMDATVVNVSLPAIIRELGLSSTEAEWMNAVYSLVFAALLLTSGRVGDLWGRKRMLVFGIGVFVAASVLAGLSTGAATLIGARVGQGLGAAAILPATLSTLNAVFVGKERAIAFAVWGSTIGGMAAVGPVVGGWLTTDVTWRWAFWLNIPLGAVILALSLWSVPETRDTSVARGVDLGGVVLSAAGLGAIVYALIEGNTYGWWRQSSGALSPVPMVGLAGIALVATFVVVQRRRLASGKSVLVDLGLLGIRSFRYGSLAALVVALGELGLLFTLPLLLQNALGYSALRTGVMILWLAVGTFLVSAATPGLTARLGGRAVVRIGLAVEVIAVAGLAFTVSSHVTSFAVAAWLFGYGVGVGMATAQLTSVILADVPVAQSGQASGLQSTFRQLGSALGVAVLGTMLFTTLGASLDSRLADAGVPASERSQVVATVRHSAGAVIPALRADAATADSGAAASDALVAASRLTTAGAAAVIAMGLLATLALPRDSARPTDRAPRRRSPRSVPTS